jgi:hypothetical protein
MDAPSELTLDKTSDFCAYMSVVISMMSQLSDCDKDVVREEIDTSVSLAWKNGADAITKAIYEAAGIKHKISLERIQAEVDFYFNVEANDAPAENGHVDIEDPTLALEALVRTLTAACKSRVETAVDVAVGDALQDFSQSIDELTPALHEALADAVIPSPEELRFALLQAVPELAVNPPTPPEDKE